MEAAASLRGVASSLETPASQQWGGDSDEPAIRLRGLANGSATFNAVRAIDPNPNPNGHVWCLL